MTNAQNITEHDDTGRVGDAQTQNSYQRYYSSGLYDQRYPKPNRNMWRLIKRHVKPETRVLDYGCGSGRYLFPLRNLVASATGFDVSPAALLLARQRAIAIDWDAVSIVGPEPADLDAHLTAQGSVDLVLCLFGVLGHITDQAQRTAVLAQMHGALDPEKGRLIISVPNRARRFRREQKQSVIDGLVSYSRVVDGEPIYLNYQLFDPESFLRELQAAGFEVHNIGPDSVLPESWLLNSFAARWLDDLLTPICPAGWGYGLVAEATP